jgi:hypothetical protein
VVREAQGDAIVVVVPQRLEVVRLHPVIRGTAARHGARPPMLASVSVRNRDGGHPLPRFGSRPANDAGNRTRRREHAAARDAGP